LHPQLGVVACDDREFVLADIPGLIEGAHEGHGLGDRFLSHVERCRVLVHLVDAGTEHAGKAYKTIRRELEAYGYGLSEKPEIIVLSKVDTVDAETLKTQLARLKRAAKCAPLQLSSATHMNVTQILRHALSTVDAANAQSALAMKAPVAWHP
jgi:GTP-binding protein